ncbi:hypothetical protein FIBSPDRAFT_101336 [Athelia psychrophila]|uniref:Uncharacterized protein n=1 Tax=Athelia psychrophila TaxID=1759441 RepID=A0A166DKG6_9AGAM|nr:hypothetical protein FIBSPDRAFT_101336 [Fibularhizoctonia sp. CBS 109695]
MSPSSSAFQRASVASFTTFMTKHSADAITMSPRSNLRDLQRMTRDAEEEGARSDGEGDLLDAYFTDVFGRPLSIAFGRDPAPTDTYPASVSFRTSMFSTRSRRSMVSSVSSASCSSSTGAGNATSSAPPSAIGEEAPQLSSAFF